MGRTRRRGREDKEKGKAHGAHENMPEVLRRKELARRRMEKIVLFFSFFSRQRREKKCNFKKQ